VRAGPLLLALASLCLGAAPLHSQAPERQLRFPQDTARRTPPAPLVALMSAAVPGSGEAALGLDRWLPRMALEAFAWWEYRAHRQEGRNFERRYRAMACQVARRIVPGECHDTTDFEYYESMGKTRYASSGSFDHDPVAPGVQPETDTTTYNGQQWQEAQRQFSSPAGALAYYQVHAIPPPFLWNWGENTLEQTVYDELIRRGDDAFRTSSRILGLILANHVTSAVDAFIAARLRELSRAPSLDLHTGFEPGPGGEVRWSAGVRVGVGSRSPGASGGAVRVAPVIDKPPVLP
jgi:hypothetical protein